jgi:hypothetical protein
MTDFSTFMDDSCGSWISYRRYLFGDKRTAGEYVTTFNIEPIGDKEYSIEWSGKTEGVMEVVVEGDQLKRSRSYFSDEETYQQMAWIDPDTVVFRTSYDGTSYREEIRFLDTDHRLRQTVGRDLETGKITLVGQYFEQRT